MTTILIVEDEVALSLLASMTLEDEGYDVITAFNGEKGLAAALKHGPALIVTDYMMPVMDGIEMIRKLRNAGFDGPVLLTSAVSERQIPGRQEVVYDAFLAKPFHEDLLVEAVKAHLA